MPEETQDAQQSAASVTPNIPVFQVTPVVPVDTTPAPEPAQPSQESSAPGEVISETVSTDAASNKPRWLITMPIPPGQREMTVEANDENEAWAKFCDRWQMNDQERSRHFANPTITQIQ